VKTGCNQAESSKEGYGSVRAVLPMTVISLNGITLCYMKIIENKHHVYRPRNRSRFHNCLLFSCILFEPLSKGCHLDVVRGPTTPHDPESDAAGSVSSWQGHPSR
jgi:hypothetical protein